MYMSLEIKKSIYLSVTLPSTSPSLITVYVELWFWSLKKIKVQLLNKYMDIIDLLLFVEVISKNLGKMQIIQNLIGNW